LQPTAEGHGGAILYEFLHEDNGRRVVQESHWLKAKAVRDGLSGPPL
jgi:hypothetical protein